jgi:UDP-glucose:(heptosyl)LPS alpha-1,3-glucosyltransferase
LAAAVEPLNFRRGRMGKLERAVVGDERCLCVAISRMVAEEFERHYGRRDGVRVVYNAVEAPEADDPNRPTWRAEVRGRLGAGPGDVVFLTVAHNFELKGVAQTIDAFGRWLARRPSGEGDGRLVVVGRESPEAYQRLAGMRSIADKVHFEPATNDLHRWYAAADACILLSWYDPCSRVILEATRWSLPSITTAYNGAAEAIAGGAGVVVGSPRDVRAVVAAMAELADPARRIDRVEACRRAAAGLGMDRHVEELLAVYEEARGR